MAHDAEKIPYGSDDTVFPSTSDADLWRSVYVSLKAAYPERVLEEHVRRSFEAVCAENSDSMLFKDFLRKVKLHWVWKRPPTPRGVVDLE